MSNIKLHWVYHGLARCPHLAHPGAQHGPAYEDRTPATNPCGEGPFQLGHFIRAHGQKKHAWPEHYKGGKDGQGAPFSSGPRGQAQVRLYVINIYIYIISIYSYMISYVCTCVKVCIYTYIV